MNNSMSHGSPEQFIAALEDQIAVLSGGIESATDIEDVDVEDADIADVDDNVEPITSSTNRNFSHGTPEQLMNLVQSKINEISGTVEGSATEEIPEDAEPITSNEDVWDIADRFVTSRPNSGDWNTEADAEMHAIMDEMGVTAPVARKMMIEELGFPPEELSTETLYRDEGMGSGIGEDGDVYTESELEDMYISFAGDPVVDDYDSFDSWLSDTVSNGYLRRITAATNSCNMAACGDINPEDDIEGCGDVVASEAIKADWDDDFYDVGEDGDMWEEIAHKQVQDSDGFMTDYTLYHYLGDPDDVDGEVYIAMFGDKDIYSPDLGYSDWSGQTEEEALDWFENYESYSSDDEDIYMSAQTAKTSVKAAAYGDYSDDPTALKLISLANLCGDVSDAIDELEVEISEAGDLVDGYITGADIKVFNEAIELLRDIKMYIRTDYPDEETY